MICHSISRSPAASRTRRGFDVAVSRLRMLEKGAIRYRADDRLTRKERTAIYCFHPIAGLTKPYPDGEIFETAARTCG